MKSFTSKSLNILLILSLSLSVFACIGKTTTDSSTPVEEKKDGTSETKKTESESDTSVLLPPKLKNAIQGDSEIWTSWEKVSDATAYIVFWGTSSGSYTSQQEVSETASEFKIIDLVNNQKYFIAVKSVKGELQSAFSNEKSAIPIESGNSIVFGPPTALVLTAGDSSIAVSWNQNLEAGSYIISWGTKSKEYTGEQKTEDTSFTITGLTNDTLYFVAVKSLRGKDISDPSEELSATPTATRVQATEKPKPDEVKPEEKQEEEVKPKTTPANLKSDLGFFFDEFTKKLTYGLFYGKDTFMESTISKIYKSFSNMGVAGFSKLGNSEKIALLLNMYNTMSIDIIRRLEPPHPILDENKGKTETFKEFFNGAFFKGENFDFFGKKFSLDDFSFGMIIGDQDYISSISDSGKKDIISKFNKSLKFSDGEFDLELLFLMGCGSPVFPFINELPTKSAISADDIDKLLKDKSQSELGRFITIFLIDEKQELDIDPDSGGFLSLGSVKALDFKLPYIFKVYDDALQRKYTAKSYKKALREFLFNYLPEDYEDREHLNKEFPDDNIKLEFIMNKKLLYID